MSALSPFDVLVFVLYLAGVLGLSLAFARGQRTNEDYFLGGRRMPWAAVGASLFATGFSSVSFVALPRETAYGDYHFLIVVLFIPLVITPILWWAFVPLFIRLGLTSVYEYLEIRFNRSLRRVGSLLFAGYAIGWMAGNTELKTTLPFICSSRNIQLVFAIAVLNFPPLTYVPLILGIFLHHLTNAFWIWILGRNQSADQPFEPHRPG